MRKVGTPLQFIVFLLGGLAVSGCETGACYYSCCSEGEDCAYLCSKQVPSAQECTAAAQQECAQRDAQIGRVEWKSVVDALCDRCGSVACAPEWFDDVAAQMSTDTDTRFGATEDPEGEDSGATELGTACAAGTDSADSSQQSSSECAFTE